MLQPEHYINHMLQAITADQLLISIEQIGGAVAHAGKFGFAAMGADGRTSRHYSPIQLWLRG